MNTQEKLDMLVEKGSLVLKTHTPNPPGVIGFPTLSNGPFTAWKTQCISFLDSTFSTTNPYYLQFKESVQGAYINSVETGISILRAAKEEIEQGFALTPSNITPPTEVIRNICDRFHLIARQLRSRYSERETLDIQDEYDVQDLLHALLHLNFDDIRPEEWTPNNAGKCTRVDFLLKSERIMIEVKKTRKGLGSAEVGSQLIEDIHRYRGHPDCDALICFVYDPDGRITNPRGLENDLTKDGDFPVRVYIRP